MDVLKLATLFEIPIEDGATLSAIEHIAPNEGEALTVCEALTPLSVSHVEFLHGGELAGVYDDCVFNNPPYRRVNEDGTVSVLISLRQKSEIEQRIETLEGAVEDLGAAVSEMAGE
jgi:hypothetical protein